MPVLSLILNSHSVENIPVAEWGSTLKELFGKAKAIQPSLKKVAVSQEFKNSLGADPSFSSVHPNTKSWLLSALIPPYLAEEDESELLDQYIENDVFIESVEQPSRPAKVSWLYGFPLLSNSLEPWDKPLLEIRVKQDNLMPTTSTIRNISSQNHINQDHEEWLISVSPAPLPVSALLASEKRIYLQDHHGKNILKPWAEKFRNCPWIEEIESGEWNSKVNRFFRQNYYHNGHWYAHCILHQTDKGYSLLFRLTALNKYEAERIAVELEKLYP